MTRRPIVLVHGYSSGPGAFSAWRSILASRGIDGEALLPIRYQSLVHFVNIADIGEAFADAIALHPRVDGEQPFDAIVHSTGMLVVRSWLALNPRRNRARLRRLVALAPATFGSPLAHKGRGYLARMIVGNKELGPDFLAAGDEVLDGLELGSRFTWDLAHEDLVGERAEELQELPRPFSFVLCGIEGYSGLRGIVNEKGTDGTVRLAATALNTRKIELDMTTAATRDEPIERLVTAPWSEPDVPMIALDRQNHGTIMSDPTATTVDLVLSALAVEDEPQYDAWCASATRGSQRVIDAAREAGDLRRWQQLVFHVQDERGHGVRDYFIDFVYRGKDQRRWRVLEDVAMDVHPYGRDQSFRCFHIDVDTVPRDEGTVLGVRLIASTGTNRVSYSGYSSDSITMLTDIETAEESRSWTAALDLSLLEHVELFHPFTTTLVELTIDRRPTPWQVLHIEGETPATVKARSLAASHARDAEQRAELEAAFLRVVADRERA